MSEAKKKLRQTWDEMSSGYQKRFGAYLMFYEQNLHLPLLGELKRKKLLDLGCGGGQTSVFFAQNGALVTGLDFSEKQLEHAERLAGQNRININFLAGDLDAPLPFADAAFDLISSSHALHYVENLEACFAEIFRVLKPGGKLVFSVSHPFMSLIAEENGRQVIARSYFKKEPVSWNWEIDEITAYPMAFTMKTVEDYFSSLRKAGFTVEALLEPPTDRDENSPWFSGEEKDREESLPGALLFCAGKNE